MFHWSRSFHCILPKYKSRRDPVDEIPVVSFQSFPTMRSSNKAIAAITCIISSLVRGVPAPSNTLGGLLGSGSQSSPNPIASQYPNSVTGTINGTVAVVPISYELARSIIPPQYGILKKAYESSLPGFPADSYPVSFHASCVWN